MRKYVYIYMHINTEIIKKKRKKSHNLIIKQHFKTMQIKKSKKSTKILLLYFKIYIFREKK